MQHARDIAQHIAQIAVAEIADVGGGEGRTSGGRHPVTPWGKPTKGAKTRNRKKASSKLIVRSRNAKKGR